MASLCKRLQCTIERRGFRQELDSWRYKLIHCIGIESILKGLLGPGLIKDLTLFKDSEPDRVCDWSFNENCLFCSLRRDKVKEHFLNVSNQGLDRTPKSLLVKDLAKINKLEKQVEEFLNAVVFNKDLPSFTDPHVPVVAREIIQRMIRQFASDYTSKSSSLQGSTPIPELSSDTSLLCLASLSGAPSASFSPGTTVAPNQSPVLSKLLMPDQDSPLDLTIKKPSVDPSEQDGVLDLSLKKGSPLGVLPVHSPHLFENTFKGKSPEFCTAKAKELQSTSTLKQFMAKLCPHHQKQIVGALGYLQTEVKTVASSNTLQVSNNSFVQQSVTLACPEYCLDTPERALPEPMLSFPSTPKTPPVVLDVAIAIPNSFVTPEKIHFDPLENSISPKTSCHSGPPLDLCTPGSKGVTPQALPILNAVVSESRPASEHAPVKIKIMKSSNVSDGKKLSCIVSTSISSNSDSLGERQSNSDMSSGAVTHSARLSSPLKRRSHSNQDSQKVSPGFSKEIPSTPSTSQKTSNAALLVSPMTARKTIRGSSYHKSKDGVCRIVTDPDLGHYDIVYVNRPITECLRVQQHRLHPRRNARKSTRGHLYVEEMWELKTVRTLASRKERDSFHTAMPELVTPVTPKQILADSDRLPHCDMPSAGVSSETEMISEQPESETPDTGYLVKAREIDLIVETSLTDQKTCKEQNCPSPSGSPLLGNDKKEVPGFEQGRDTLLSEESIAVTQLETESESELYNQIRHEKETEQERIAETFLALETEMEPIVKKRDKPETTVQTLKAKTDAETICLDKNSAEAHEILNKNVDEISSEVAKKVVVRTEIKPSEGSTNETAEPQNLSEEAQNSETIPQQEREALHPAMVGTGAKDKDIEAGVNKEKEKPSDIDELKFASLHVEETKPLPEEMLKRQVKNKVSAPDSKSDIVVVPVMEDNDVSSKTLEALLKELPPWRRKRGALQSTSKQVREVPCVIVGYVNGRPIAASDRSLRRRSNKNSLEKCEPCILEKSCPNSPLTVSVANSENCGTLSKQLLNTNEESTCSSYEAEQMMVPPETSPCSVSDDPSKSSLTLTKIKSDPKTKQVQQESTELGQIVQESFPSGHLDQPVHSPSSSESKTPLRSAQQELAGASASPSIANAVTSSAMVDASIPPSTDLSTPLPISSPSIAESSPPVYVVSSPLVDPPPSTPGLASCLENVIPENAKEVRTKVKLAPDVELDIAQNTGVETKIQNRQKLRSANLVSKDEAVISELVTPAVSEEATLSDSCCVVKTEVPAHSSSLRCKRILGPSKVTLPEGTELSSSLNKKPLTVCSRRLCTSDKLARMPLRSETGKVLGSQFATLATQSVAAKNRKSFLRYLRSATPSSSFHNAVEKQKGLTSVRVKPGKTLRTPVSSSVLSVTAMLPSSSTTNRVLPMSDPPKLKTPKYLEALNSEEHQQIITNLNSKFDKMQRGWVQMDREGQPAPKHKNKADRQAAIWKSKTRRTRRPKSQEHQRYSPVQMLFMKNFDLTSICRWFFESTETKSLVIVKKVNTRLPSETQLCFHNSSNVPGTSQGVFPSLQAERLKKHLKKFAVASPVKSNAKSQKLIAKALEQEASIITEKDKAELTTAARISTKPHTSAEAQAQMVEIQKGSAKSKNPTSARILRKYTNIREKMQVQQTSMKLKETPRKSLKATNVKTNNKSKSKLAPVKKQKGHFSKGKERKDVLVAKAEKGKMASSRKATARAEVQETVIKTNKDVELKCSLRPGTPQKTKSSTVNTFASLSHAKEREVETPKRLLNPNPTIASGAKTQTKRLPQGKATEVVPVVADQVLTRSQSKLEAVLTPSVSQKAASNKIPRTTVVHRGSLKSVFRRRQLALASSGTQKLTKKRAQEESQEEVPAKRTRMPLAK